MNLLNLALNLIPSKVTNSSFTMLYRRFFILILELSEAITVYSNGSLILGMNVNKPSAYGIFLDGKNSILKE